MLTFISLSAVQSRIHLIYFNLSTRLIKQIFRFSLPQDDVRHKFRLKQTSYLKSPGNEVVQVLGITNPLIPNIKNLNKYSE